MYMAEQLRRHPMPATSTIGVDKIAIRKGYDYRVVVSDLESQRPIWFGGTGRKQEDLAQLFAAYGRRRCAGIRVAVMDMWRPFRQATHAHAPQAEIVFDKFHILRHLNDALNEVRRSEYARVQGKQRRFIKGNHFTLLAHRENLWQGLKRFEKFADMIERHWDGIFSYCKPQNKVSLVYAEGLNNTIRVIQRTAYGFRDEQYLAMKIITQFLPELPKNAKNTHTIPPCTKLTMHPVVSHALIEQIQTNLSPSQSRWC